MDWLKRMNNAISYIEDNLEGKVDYEKAQEKPFHLYTVFKGHFHL